MPRGPNEPESEFERMLRPEHEVAEDDALAERLRQERASIRATFIRMQMENPLFREWLMEQLVWLGTFTTPVSVAPAGVPDQLGTYFALGQHAAGWRLWTMFDDAEPELASLMRREAVG